MSGLAIEYFLGLYFTILGLSGLIPTPGSRSALVQLIAGIILLAAVILHAAPAL